MCNKSGTPLSKHMVVMSIPNSSATIVVISQQLRHGGSRVTNNGIGRNSYKRA
jgi:hypothetical protein